MTPPDPRAQRAYQLYIDDGLALENVARKLGAGRRPVRRWILALGGKIRTNGPHGDRDTATQIGSAQTGWRNAAKCSIGYAKKGTHSMGGSWYCGRHCEHGNCDEKATVQDLAAFARLTEEREADEKLRKERKAKKLSGGALWRGVRGKVKWR